MSLFVRKGVAQLFACRCIPKPAVIAKVTGKDTRSVRSERRGLNICQVLELKHLFTRRRIPNDRAESGPRSNDSSRITTELRSVNPRDIPNGGEFCAGRLVENGGRAHNKGDAPT